MSLTSKWLNRLSGLPLTLIGLVCFLSGILPVVLGKSSATLALAPGYIILLVNLIFAMLVREKIRNNIYLLIFHFSLLLMLVSVGVSRATYFKGWVQIAQDEVLSQPSGTISKGFLHSDALEVNPIRLSGFQANFYEDGRRGDTQSWLTSRNLDEPIVINNSETADISGYQFTVSGNLGFAAEITWMSAQGDMIQGKVHFPSQIAFPETQGTELLLPGMKHPIWVGLEIQSSRKSFFYPYFKVPNEYYLQLDLPESQVKVFPDSSVQLAEGSLAFHRLSPWVGYDLYYDPAIYFLLITSLMGVLSLAVFMWQKQTESSWIQENNNE